MRIDENEEEIISIELWKATMNVDFMVRTEHKYTKKATIKFSPTRRGICEYIGTI